MTWGVAWVNPPFFWKHPNILYHSESTNYIFMGWNHQPEELRGSTVSTKVVINPRLLGMASYPMAIFWIQMVMVYCIRNSASQKRHVKLCKRSILFMDLTPNGTKFQSLGPYSWTHMKHPLGSGSREAKINPKWQVLFLSRCVKMSYWHGLL